MLLYYASEEFLLQKLPVCGVSLFLMLRSVWTARVSCGGSISQQSVVPEVSVAAFPRGERCTNVLSLLSPHVAELQGRCGRPGGLVWVKESRGIYFSQFSGTFFTSQAKNFVG